MKRFAVILLAFVMVFSMTYAESIDLTGMSDEELLTLSDSLDAELIDRNLRPILSVGDYIGGEDIGVGKYVVHEHSEEEHKGDWYVRIYKSEDSVADFQKAKTDYQAAYEIAKDNKEAGKDYAYPPEVVSSDYFTQVLVGSGGTLAFSINDGEVLRVYKDYWVPDASYLSISKSEGLFMN